MGSSVESLRISVLRAISDDCEDFETICRDLHGITEDEVSAALGQLVQEELACPYAYSQSLQRFAKADADPQAAARYWYRATKAGRELIERLNIGLLASGHSSEDSNF